MATLPTADEKGRRILDIYKHFGSKPGHVLQNGNFVSVAANKGYPVDEIADGLEYAYDKGWVEDGPNQGHKLTESGFAEM
jgi:hypothetical protein